MIVPDASTVRLDAVALGAPTYREDGSAIFEGVLARVGVPLVYEWGTEVATEDALRDPVYLDGLTGRAIVVHHPASGSHRIDSRRGAEAGRVLSARYDEAGKHVAIRFVVTRRAAISDIRAGRLPQLSEGYTIPEGSLRKRADGVYEQLRRVTDHAALTDSARAAGAIIRTDEVPMDPEDIEALAAKVADIIASRRNDADTSAKVADANRRADEAVAARDAVLAELGLKADAKPADVAAAVAARAEAVVAIRRRADELGQPLPATGTLEELTRELAKKLPRADTKRCDDLAYCQAVIDLAQSRTDAAPSSISQPAV